MSPTKVIKLTVISDIICPWCYIGQRELDNALKMCSDLPVQVEIEYRPYRIYPSLSDGQFLEKLQWYESKFGSEKIKTMETMILPRARELGIDLKFTDGIITQTTLAHRLMLKAWKMGGQSTQQALLAALFKGYFEASANIGDTDVLADMAVIAKMMTKEEAVSFLESDELLDEVETMINESKKKGINGVPFIVINGKWAVSGGQTAEIFTQIFTKLANHDPTTPRPTYATPSNPPKSVATAPLMA
ncbi:hypothetical protein PHLGIDRAFT_92714 [Phlebiopsis gigantea 11061_1 CR5-6]|uniref:DSBA-like thioredoxin domain-containing protein n=1 Tax=Phlebiopsis gigantea (strain 11061_1 CR5-6) TaxID=745531 RepID=A0A0C3PGV2_PHLG1|nr:hypothetical protein PHLGIDRAFT_92714 [Phlebiopsis gigantea 11061_1 CR5-6]